MQLSDEYLWQRLQRTFWRKVRPAPGGACWEWIGKRYRRTGYGRVTIRNKDHRAHRVAYQLAIGPIPKGWVICHACDNPSCVRPSHLWADTQKNNVRDMVEKERHWYARDLVARIQANRERDERQVA